MRRVLQSLWAERGLPVIAMLMGVVTTAGLILVDPEPRLTHPAIGWSALLAVLLWAGALVDMLATPTGEWGTGERFRKAQVGWLGGWLVFLVHVAATFHFAHGWSHAAAYEHTERTAGIGEGIFVNYLFGLVWGLDVAWLMGFPASYARRPRWVGWAVHGFLTFVVFNATVVYGTGVSRWLGMIVFAVLGWCWLRSRDR
jgi:hypothetical protein